MKPTRESVFLTIQQAAKYANKLLRKTLKVTMLLC